MIKNEQKDLEAEQRDGGGAERRRSQLASSAALPSSSLVSEGAEELPPAGREDSLQPCRSTPPGGHR